MRMLATTQLLVAAMCSAMAALAHATTAKKALVAASALFCRGCFYKKHCINIKMIMKSSKNISIIKNNWFFFLICVIILCLLFILIYTGNQEQKGFWPHELISALLGTATVAAITCLLLKGQTSSENVLEQNKKVFENRLKAYDSFLEALKEVVINNVVDEKNEKQLQFGIATIGMHTDSRDMLIVSRNLKSILQKIKVPERADGSIWNELMEIVNVFHHSLYVDDQRAIDKDMRKAIRNFRGLYMDGNYAILEKVECLLAVYHFDSFIIDKCLFYCIHVRNSNNILLKKIYVTLRIDECLPNDTFNGIIAIYTDREYEDCLNNLISSITSQNKNVQIECMKDVKLGSVIKEHAFVLKFDNKDTMALQSSVGDIFVFFKSLWAENGATYTLRDYKGDLVRCIFKDEVEHIGGKDVK